MPAVEREFRGVWVATVANIDWPSAAGLPVEEQRRELLALLDRAAELNLNAVIFQVRPAADALYPSALEPWSEYLTGEMGLPPVPFWDPLAFAVEEAHRRGLELHAWFNPYRARHATGAGPAAPEHLSRARPELVRQYGRQLWLDPGEAAVQEHTLAVIRDVVRRYDIDGVHLDDYFYPYQERGANGRPLPFPDDGPWLRYRQAGGTLSRDDWRRENVCGFIERLHAAVKAEKPWVRVGISPFGIWRPGNPPQVRGLDAYAELYADSRKWLANGWLDYFAPQLYWRIDPPAQSYPVLLDWWVEQNHAGRHLWPGNFASRVGDGWPAGEIIAQVQRTRSQPGASGNIHFSARALLRNAEDLGDRLARELYAEPALVPAFPWLDDTPPQSPRFTALHRPGENEDGALLLLWEHPEPDDVWRWLLQVHAEDGWRTRILPRGERAAELPADATWVALSAVDRCGNQSPPALFNTAE